MNYKELSQKLVAKCLKLGADAAEVYIETGRRLSIRLLNSEIDTIQESSSAGVGFRVIVDGRLGFSHSNDFSTRSLDDTIQRAVAFAKLTTPDEFNVLPSDPVITDVSGLYDPEIISVPMERKIEMARELERLAMLDPRITKSSGSGYGEEIGRASCRERV